MYEKFLSQNIDCARQIVDNAFLAKYANTAPTELIALWQEVGLGIFGDGLFRIVPPNDYQDLVDTYIEDRAYTPQWYRDINRKTKTVSKLVPMRDNNISLTTQDNSKLFPVNY